jgi:hypothetical protein
MLPARRRKAKNELHEKLNTLREKLVASLTARFDQEMLRSSRRIEEAVAPFSRFVRAESEKFKKRQAELQAIKSELDHLQSEIRQL